MGWAVEGLYLDVNVSSAIDEGSIYGIVIVLVSYIGRAGIRLLDCGYFDMG